ncbi:oxidoreductase [Streptomyces sp. NPDC021224]|uniref:oxidoreductase n=1 Tax=unclassified Streptomyces TaxID=2593676 RepID=UPI0037BA9B3C
MTRESRWRADQMPDQDGRVFVVTGANSGLGLATTRALARKGARVVLAVRDEEKGRRAVVQLMSEQARARLEVRPLDLADLASVHAFADGLKSDGVHPDVLVNNAGLMAPPRTLTAGGQEVQFAANHLGHFALTALLLGLMADSDDPRVVTVTSANHRQARMFFDDLTGERKYAPMGYYNQSKLANALFGWELHRRLGAVGSRVRSVLAHPGYTATGLQTSAPVGRVKFVFGRLLLPLAQAPEQGALPQLYAATDPQARGGELYGPDGMGELRGAPKRVELAPRATDPAAAARLWQLSEQLTGVSFALPAVV